jgi:hypothetical protein
VLLLEQVSSWVERDSSSWRVVLLEPDESSVLPTGLATTDDGINCNAPVENVVTVDGGVGILSGMVSTSGSLLVSASVIAGDVTAVV